MTTYTASIVESGIYLAYNLERRPHAFLSLITVKLTCRLSFATSDDLIESLFKRVKALINSVHLILGQLAIFTRSNESFRHAYSRFQLAVFPSCMCYHVTLSSSSQGHNLSEFSLVTERDDMWYK